MRAKFKSFGEERSAHSSEFGLSEGPSTSARVEALKELDQRFARTRMLSPIMRRRLRLRLRVGILELRRRGFQALKRVLDLSVASIALILLAPLMTAVAFVIKATDGGPILYCQTRVGQHGREFDFPKFRSMVPKAEKLLADINALNLHGDGVTFKMKRDPRVTWIGRLIRRASIDELPQLMSVLRGDMTLVGPRPALPREVELYSAGDRRRLEATPGITCIWQVSGRSDIPFDEQVELDVEYIEGTSIKQDLLLLLKTIPAVLSGKGAY